MNIRCGLSFPKTEIDGAYVYERILGSANIEIGLKQYLMVSNSQSSGFRSTNNVSSNGYVKRKYELG